MNRDTPEIKPAAVVVFLRLPINVPTQEQLEEMTDAFLQHPDAKEMAGPYINGLIAVTFQTEFSEDEETPFRPYMTYMQNVWDSIVGDST